MKQTSENKMMKQTSENKMIWHPYHTCGDAPHVDEYQKEIFLCKTYRYARKTGEEIGAPSYKVLVCDDNGSFFGTRSDDMVVERVVAWTEILKTDLGDSCRDGGNE